MAVLSFLSEFQGILAFVLVLCSALVNGWTDAPVAITAVVATKTLSIKKAAAMAGIFNLLGAVTFMLINRNVALTVFNIANLGTNYSYSLSLIVSALAAVNIWSVAAWFFGIPTSESHGILAAVSGASFYLYKNFNGINLFSWFNVLLGIFFSVALGFILSFVIIKIFLKLNRKTSSNLKRLEIFSSALLAFMHGAQDSQKFAGLLVLVLFGRKNNAYVVDIPLWSAIITGFVICIGTAIGGGRIIKKTGTKMVELDLTSGLCSNLSSSVSMLFSSLLGLAVSTTHSCTASLLGAALGAKKRVSVKDTLDVFIAWVLTFPACFFISFLICAVFL